MQRVYVLVHVDDRLIIRAKKTVQAALAVIAGVFNIKNIGEAVYFLGLEMHRNCARARAAMARATKVCAVHSRAFQYERLQGSRDDAGGERAPWQVSGRGTHG